MEAITNTILAVPREFVLGLVGFLGFEALRCYKLITNGRRIDLKESWLVYALVLIAVGCFSGTVAWALAEGQIRTAIYIGFSCPTAIKAILESEGGRRRLETAEAVEDIRIQRASIVQRLRAAAQRYFGYR